MFNNIRWNDMQDNQSCIGVIFEALWRSLTWTHNTRNNSLAFILIILRVYDTNHPFFLVLFSRVHLEPRLPCQPGIPLRVCNHLVYYYWHDHIHYWHHNSPKIYFHVNMYNKNRIKYFIKMWLGLWFYCI